MIDVFSDVLRLIRLKSCVYFLRDFWTPWAMQLGGVEVAQFHAVLRGHCCIEAGGKTFEGVPGDIFLFPRGEPHVIADTAGQDAVLGSAFMQSLTDETPLFSDGATSTQLLCGHYEFRQDIQHPLLTELPSVIHIRNRIGTTHDILPILIREMNSAHPGATMVVEKLAEILLVEIIRASIAERGHPTGFFQGLTDHKIAKAIQLVHQSPDQILTLDEMSAAAGMSRSAFALHFKVTTGTTPIAYLTSWRMCLAHDYLQSENLSVWQTAGRVGYASEIAFSRAFKRHFGVNPGRVRQNTPQPANE